MAIIERVSCFPNEGEPEVIGGDPIAGDLVRITTDSGTVIYERYTPHVPHTPDPTKGRNITMGDFLKIGYAIGLADQIDATLVSMPSLGMFLQQYVTHAGIEFADATSSQPNTIKTAFARMKAAGHVDDAKIAEFISAWAQMYPEA
jgi:hypothetical protein